LFYVDFLMFIILYFEHVFSFFTEKIAPKMHLLKKIIQNYVIFFIFATKLQ